MRSMILMILVLPLSAFFHSDAQAFTLQENRVTVNLKPTVSVEAINRNPVRVGETREFVIYTHGRIKVPLSVSYSIDGSGTATQLPATEAHLSVSSIRISAPPVVEGQTEIRVELLSQPQYKLNSDRGKVVVVIPVR